jgi:prevent-host-death family protein
MRPLQISEDVLPIRELKSSPARVLRRLKESHRPVVLTQHGRPAAVLISPQEFDEMRERERFMAAVRAGLADAEAGRVVDDNEVRRELDLEFGRLRKARRDSRK